MSSYRFLFYSHTPRAWKPCLSMLHLELTIAFPSWVGVEFRVGVDNWRIRDYGGNRLPSQGPISPSSLPLAGPTWADPANRLWGRPQSHVEKKQVCFTLPLCPSIGMQRTRRQWFSNLNTHQNQLEGCANISGLHPQSCSSANRLGSEHLQVLQVPKCCWCCQPGDPRAAP